MPMSYAARVIVRRIDVRILNYMTEGDLQIVVLDEACAHWDQPNVVSLFSDITALKFRGYRDDYSVGALPVDATDFVGAHVVIRDKRSDQILMGYKWVTSDRARKYNLDFPALSAVRQAGSTRHEGRLRQLLEDQNVSKRLGYIGSWTIGAEQRARPEQARLLVRVSIAAHYAFARTYRIDECFALGVPRLRTEKIQLSAGYELVDDGEAALGPFPLRSLADEPVCLMHLKHHSNEARALADEYAQLWDERLCFGRMLATQQGDAR